MVGGVFCDGNIGLTEINSSWRKTSTEKGRNIGRRKKRERKWGEEYNGKSKIKQ